MVNGLHFTLTKMLGKDIVGNTVSMDQIDLVCSLFGNDVCAAAKMIEDIVKTSSSDIFAEKGYNSAEEYIKAEKETAKLLNRLHEEAALLYGDKIMSKDIISWDKFADAAKLFNFNKMAVLNCLKHVAISEKSEAFVEAEMEVAQKAKGKATNSLNRLHEEAVRLYGDKIMSEDIISWDKFTDAAALFNFRKSGNRTAVLNCLKHMAISEKSEAFVEAEIKEAQETKGKASIKKTEDGLGLESQSLIVNTKLKSSEDELAKTSEKLNEMLSAPIDESNFEAINEMADKKESSEEDVARLTEKSEKLAKKIDSKKEKKESKMGVETDGSKAIKTIKRLGKSRGFDKLLEMKEAAEVKVTEAEMELERANKDVSNNKDESLDEALKMIAESANKKVADATAELSAATGAVEYATKNMQLTTDKVNMLREEFRKDAENIKKSLQKDFDSDLEESLLKAMNDESDELFEFLAGVFGYDWRALKAHLEKYGFEFSPADEMDLIDRVETAKENSEYTEDGYTEEELEEEKEKLQSMYSEKVLRDIEAKLLLQMQEAFRKEETSKCIKHNKKVALSEKADRLIKRRTATEEKKIAKNKTNAKKAELAKELGVDGIKALTKEQKASCQYTLTDSDRDQARINATTWYKKFGITLSKKEYKLCTELSQVQSAAVEAAVAMRLAEYKEILTPEFLMMKAIESELDKDLDVKSFLKSGHTTPKKDFNKKLHEERHIVPTFVALKDGGWEMTYTVANNSEMLRYMEKEYGVIQDGRQISFKKASDDAKESETSKKINNVSWTCSVEGRYRLHEKAIKLSFNGAKHLASLEAYIRSCGIFACNLEEGTIRRINNRSQLIEGERAYIFGDWTQSGEKAYKVMAYELEEDEIFKIFNKLTNEAFTKAYEAGMDVKSSRYTSVVAPASVKVGNLADIVKESNNYALFLKAPLDSVREIDPALADLLELSKEGPDGAFYLSEFLTGIILKEMSGKEYPSATVVKTNMQMRMGLNALKGFGITVNDDDLDLFAGKLKERFKDLFEIVGNPNGKCIFIADSNACKILNSANGVVGDMDMFVLGIPSTSEQVHLSTQIYINLQDLINRAELDDIICDMVEMEVDRRRRNFIKNNKFISNNCQAHQALIAALGPKAIHTNLARKALLKELSQMAVKIADKGSVPLQGIAEKVTCDPVNSLTNGAIQNVLGFADGYMEVYSPYAEKKGLRYGVMKKFPAQGTVEFVMVKFLKMHEVIGNIDTALKASGYDGPDKKRVRLAVIRFMRNLGYGTLMVPASALLKECLAGMDFDYDGVTVYTEPFIVEALRAKLGKYAMKVCAIRYSGAKSDKKVGSMVREASSETNLKHVKGSFTEEEADSLHKEAEEVIENLDCPSHRKMTLKAIFGSVIGKTVSASDLGVTIDTNYYFDNAADDAKLNLLGKIVFKKVFPNLGKNSDCKGDYKTIFATEHGNFHDTFMSFASNDYKAAVEIYKVDKDTVNAFIDALRATDINSLTLDGYRKMAYELSFVARALGESAIDILKKGSEVDLGFRIEQVVGPNKKLSSVIKRVDSNFDKWIKPALYNEADPDNSMFRFNFDERIHKLEGFLLKGEDFPVDASTYENLSKLSEKEKEEALDMLVVVDKFGLLKLKMLKRLEAKINAIAEDFKDDKETISGAFLVEKATGVYNECFGALSDGIFKAMKHNSAPGTTNKVIAEKARKRAEQLSNAAMGSINAILDGVRDFMLSGNVEKHLKDLVRKAIVTQLKAVFGSYIELDAKKIVMLSAYAYMHRYCLGDGVRRSERSAVLNGFNANAFNCHVRWKPENSSSERLIDGGFYVLFKVFGALLGYIWGDHLYAELEVTRLEGFKDFGCHNASVFGVHFDEDIEEYVATMNGVDCCTVSVPDGIELFDHSIKNVRLFVEKNLDREGNVECYAEKLITELHADVSSLLEGKRVKPIVLDRYIGTDGNVLCCAAPISAPNITNPEYNEYYLAKGKTFLSDHLEDVLGEKYTPVKESKYFIEEKEIDEETGEVLKTKIVVDYALQNNEVVTKKAEMPNHGDNNLSGYEKEAVFVEGRYLGNALFTNAKTEGTVAQLIGNILIIEQQ